MNGAPVLLIAYLYPPYEFIGAARPHRFAKYLERMGREVTVLAAGPDARPRVEGRVHRVRTDFDFMVHKERVLPELLLRKFLFPGEFGMLWSARAARYGARLLAGMERPVIVSTSPPLASQMVAMWLKKRTGAPWIADFRDPFLGYRTERRYRWLDPRLEAAIFRRADAVVANTGAAADVWRARYPELRGKIHVIWNGFDPEEPLGPEPLPPRDHAVLAHLGSVYGMRHPGLLLGAMDRLIRSGRLDPARLRVHFVGPFERTALRDAEVFDRLAAAGTVVLTPKVERAEARRIMATSDYLLLLDWFGGLPPVQVPAKAFEYLRVGRPVLALTPRHSPLEFVLAASGVPHVCFYGDDGGQALEEKLLRFLALPPVAAPPAERFGELFDGSRQAEELAALIDAVSPRGRKVSGVTV